MTFRPALIHSRTVPICPGFGTAALEIIARLDYVLLVAVAALLGFGLWIISTITRDDVRGDPSFFVSRQGVAAAIGIVAMVLLTATNPNFLRRLRLPFYVATVVLLIVVLLAPAVPRHAPLDRPRLLQLPALGVRQGHVGRRPGRVRRGSGQPPALA